MSFRITGLPAENFQHLFSLDDVELAALGAVRRNAPGAVPCRISLTDATPGEEVILTNYEHHAVDSPYRMRFAIYVRKGELRTGLLPTTSLWANAGVVLRFGADGTYKMTIFTDGRQAFGGDRPAFDTSG